MSLVSEALRKARQEDERGGAPGPRPRFFFGGSGPASSRLGTGLVLGAIIAMVAALAGGTVAWWVVGGRHNEAPLHTTGPAAPPPGAEPVVDRATGTVAATTIGGEIEAADAVRAAATETDGPASEVRDEETAGAAVVAQAVDGGAEEGRRPAEMPTPVALQEGPREFVGVATIGDVTLTLGYLVYRPTNPFVQINGIDVRAGSIIEGFVVDEITRDQVILHDDEGPVVIRVH